MAWLRVPLCVTGQGAMFVTPVVLGGPQGRSDTAGSRGQSSSRAARIPQPRPCEAPGKKLQESPANFTRWPRALAPSEAGRDPRLLRPVPIPERRGVGERGLG